MSSQIDVSAGIILNENKNILIGKRRNPEKLANKWEFPGGKIEPGETPEKCLRREIKEEFGIEIKVKNKIGEIYHEYEFENIKFHVFFAKWENGKLKPTDHKEIKWIFQDELRDYDFTPADIKIINKIKDAIKSLNSKKINEK